MIMSSLEVKVGKRKTVNMNEDIAQELNRLANLQGKTLYSLINEIGLSALEANKNGFGLEDAVKAKKLMDRATRSRMLLVNQDLWYFASSQALKASKASWLKRVHDCAQWQANVFLTGSSDAEFIASMRSHLSDFFWDCGECRIDETDGGNSLSMRLAFVPEMPLEHTQGLFKVFEGMFNAHGYAATDSTVEPGFLTVSFKKVDRAVTPK
jgi:hypothetical protein